MGNLSRQARHLAERHVISKDDLPAFYREHNLILIDASVLLHLIYNRHYDLAYRIASRAPGMPIERMISFLLIYSLEQTIALAEETIQHMLDMAMIPTTDVRGGNLDWIVFVFEAKGVPTPGRQPSSALVNKLCEKIRILYPGHDQPLDNFTSGSHPPDAEVGLMN